MHASGRILRSIDNATCSRQNGNEYLTRGPRILVKPSIFVSGLKAGKQYFINIAAAAIRVARRSESMETSQ